LGGAVQARRRDIDALRGVAICLVIAGHLGFADLGATWLVGVIYSFHIPLFVFMSGYVLWRPDAQPTRKWLARRFQGLMLPYIAWTAIYWGLSWLTTRTMPPVSRLHRLGFSTHCSCAACSSRRSGDRRGHFS
jgi:fucose 4-O-acetylase-like acetyltransferase